MSSGSLAGLTSKVGSKDNVDISSSSLSDIPELDAFTIPSSNPGVLSKRPGPQPIPIRGGTNPRRVISRIPSEFTSGPPSPSASMDTVSRGMRSFITDADTSTALDDSALDTPAKDKKSFLGDEAADVRKRGRASLGAPPRGQMTLREQEKLIDMMKKDNFSLKMKVHFLEERLTEMAPEHMEATFKANVRLKVEVHARGAEIKKLKKLVLELEKELSELHERERERSARGPNAAVLERFERELDEKDEEIRELKKRLKVAEGSKLSSSSNPTLKRLQDDNAALLERQADLEDQLERRRVDLEETNEEMENLRAAFQQRVDENENDSTRRRIKDLERINEELEKQLADCEAELKNQAEEDALLREDLDQLAAQLEESERRRQADAVERSVSRAEIIEEREEREALEQNANEFRDKLAAATIELEAKEDEIDELRTTIKSLEAEFNDRLGEQEGILRKYERELDVLEEQKAKAEAARAQAEATVADQLDQIEKAMEHLDREMKEKEFEKQEALRDLAEQHERDMVATNTEIDAQGKRIWELEEALDEEHDMIERLKQEREDRMEEHELTVRTLKEKLADRKAEIDDLRDRYEECRQQIIAHADRSQQIDDHCHDLEDEIDAIKAGAKRDVDEAHNLVRKLEDRLQKQEDRHKKELDDSERRRKRDIATLEGEQRDAESAINALRKQVAQRDDDIAVLQAELNEMQTESRKLGESHTTDRFALELELEKVKRELIRAEEDVERLKKDLSNREEKYRERENALDKLHTENRDLATQLAAQTQARLNVSDKLDLVQAHAKTTEAELVEVRARNAELEKRQSKGERQLQSIDKEYRDQLTERNTLLLTIYQYIGKIQGLDTTPKKGATTTTRPLTNFPVFHEELMSRLKAISQLTTDFEKRTKTIEQKFQEKFNDLRKQLDYRWKQIDRFEAGLKTATEKRDAWRKKYAAKDGELEATKASVAELTAQLNSLKKTGVAGPSDLTTAEMRGMATRVANLDRRATHAANSLLKKDEEMNAMRDDHRKEVAKFVARIKELERLHQALQEKLKQEKQGSKEAVAAMQRDIDILKEQLASIRRREAQMVEALKQHDVPFTEKRR
ncbi:hypothetical protein FS837_010342 [Tulasnella sp. UAMH 9824]|nr:hypothetical protein FS837_010342 [Tulasnella sp. UAMH 9824]